MKYLPLDPRLFIENRKRFVRQMLPHALAVFNSNDEVTSNGDALYKFKQNADLYWLSGIDQEDTQLVFYPGNPDPRYREVLVLRRPDPLKEKWDGHRLTAAEGTTISGIQTVVWLDELEGLLQRWVHEVEEIYLNTNENDRKADTPPTRDYRYAAQLRERFPLHRYHRAAPILKTLRSVKTKYEIAVMQQAMDITEDTFRHLLRFIRPGVWEHEIHAEILHQFLRQRATGEAYASIIASGDRARTLHYVYNNQECKSGEVILMDFGAEYGGYCADLTRSVPVNGRFTKRQKEVYNACLHLHNYARKLLKPGLTIAAYHAEVGKEAEKTFVKIGLLDKADIKNQDPAAPAYRKYLYHGISHYLGVDVHDLGPSFSYPIPDGAVLTVEPGIYIEEEQLGIRIENNVWVKKGGNVDLMKNIPIEAGDIERLMQRSS
ncbi:aminopeptidase P family protein [Compostibacter hankyongensis]|uniref:Xaa-Pro aminopeptidase n=1 Tax=Compostibacter hankyongensis TaxID=1007089 RepID=A0ABP8FFD8_9BACT